MDNQEKQAGTEVPATPTKEVPKTKKPAKVDPETFLANKSPRCSSKQPGVESAQRYETQDPHRKQTVIAEELIHR